MSLAQISTPFDRRPLPCPNEKIAIVVRDNPELKKETLSFYAREYELTLVPFANETIIKLNQIKANLLRYVRKKNLIANADHEYSQLVDCR